MVHGNSSPMSGYVLVVLRMVLYCVLQTKVSGGLNPYVQLVPLIPHAQVVPYSYYQNQNPYLLTSGAAPVRQPVVSSLLGALGRLPGQLTGGLGLGGGAGAYPGRPTLPRNFFTVRQPDIRPGTSNNASQGHAEENHYWSYDDSVDSPVGPKQWHKMFPKCARTLQSPIDLSGPTVRFQQIKPMVMRTWDGSRTTPVRIKNDGASVSVKPSTSNVIVEGGSLPGQFVVTNFHFHWSHDDLTGSEHKLAGRYYPLEIHIVTFNRKYKNFQEASGASDGIHVIGILYEISKRGNVGLNFCTSKLDSVLDIGAEVDGGNIDITSLLPSANVPMFRYRGSLTTPPCTENIIWTVYASPQVISIDQLQKFRRLKMGTKTHSFIGGNYRPLAPMDNRVIFTNSPTFSYH